MYVYACMYMCLCPYVYVRLVPVTLVGLFVAAWNQYRRGDALGGIDRDGKGGAESLAIARHHTFKVEASGDGR